MLQQSHFSDFFFSFSVMFYNYCFPCFQTRTQTTAWRLLRGRAPRTARTLSADTGTDEGLPNPNLEPPSPPRNPTRSHGLETEQTVRASPVINFS